MPKRADPDRALAEVLRQLRLERGRTQEDLAHEVGLTAASLRRIERAHATPTWSTVRALAKALGVTLEQLGAAVEKQEKAAAAPIADGRSRRR